MDSSLWAPSIPALKDKRWIDLVELGDKTLLTYIKYDGIEEGDLLHPNWRGCSAVGTAFDYANSVVMVQKPDYSEELGMPVRVPNDTVKVLDQGWAFYSYSVTPAKSALRLPESKRLFFYVGERHMNLPVAQIKESHGLYIDKDKVPSRSGATVVVTPYQAMAMGDKVTLCWQGYSASGVSEPLWTTPKDVLMEDVGQALLFILPRTQVLTIPKGYGDLYYRITHVGGGPDSESDFQRFHIDDEVEPRLPKVKIEDNNGEPINPDQYVDGLPLQVIPVYENSQPNDDVLFYWTSPDADKDEVFWTRIDPSTLRRDALGYVVPHNLLADNIGSTIEISYQYARVNRALSSDPLPISIVKSQDLPPPIIQDAEGEPGGLRGTLAASNITRGVNISVPSQVTLEAGERLEMHWHGHPIGGRTVADPNSGTEKKFYIPPEFVAANMGDETKRFPVFYRIMQDDSIKDESTHFDLKVTMLESQRYPAVQCCELGSNSTLSLGSLDPEGATTYCGAWPFAGVDQLLTIKVSGVSDGKAVELILRDAVPVSKPEFDSKNFSAKVPMDFLQTLDLGHHMAMKFFISFDQGSSSPIPFKQLLDVKVVE
ncbi:hypothetical protein SB766_01615 [Pseudomonas sp. SIMBA_077]